MLGFAIFSGLLGKAPVLLSELVSHFAISLSVSFLCKYKWLPSLKEVRITVSIKTFGVKELQEWYKEGASAVELRKKMLKRGNLMVTSVASSSNVMREVVETMGKILENTSWESPRLLGI